MGNEGIKQITKEDYEKLAAKQEAVLVAESQVKYAKHIYLRAMGWEANCELSYWLWSKEIKGEKVMVGLDTAISLADIELDNIASQFVSEEG